MIYADVLAKQKRGEKFTKEEETLLSSGFDKNPTAPKAKPPVKPEVKPTETPKEMKKEPVVSHKPGSSTHR